MTIPTNYSDMPTIGLIYEALVHDADSQDADWLAFGEMPAPVDVDAQLDAEQAEHRDADIFMRVLIALAVVSAVVISLTGCGGGDICDEQPAMVECRVIPPKDR